MASQPETDSRSLLRPSVHYQYSNLFKRLIILAWPGSDYTTEGRGATTKAPLDITHCQPYL